MVDPASGLKQSVSPGEYHSVLKNGERHSQLRALYELSSAGTVDAAEVVAVA